MHKQVCAGVSRCKQVRAGVSMCQLLLLFRCDVALDAPGGYPGEIGETVFFKECRESLSILFTLPDGTLNV